MPNGHKDDNEDENTKRTTGQNQDENVIDEQYLDDLLSDLDNPQFNELLTRYSVTSVEERHDQALGDLTDRLQKELQRKRYEELFKRSGMSEEVLEGMGGLDSVAARENFDEAERLGLLVLPEEEKPEELKWDPSCGITEDELDEIIADIQDDYDHATQKAIEELEMGERLLQAKREYLQKHATWKDKIKAFFKHGAKGVDGEIEKLDRKIEASQLAISDMKTGMTPEYRREQVESLKAQLAENRLRLDQRAGHVVDLRLEQSLPSHKLSSEAREKAERGVEESELLKSVRKDLKARLKVVEKAAKISEHGESVREAFGGGERRIPKKVLDGDKGKGVTL